MNIYLQFLFEIIKYPRIFFKNFNLLNFFAPFFFLNIPFSFSLCFPLILLVSFSIIKIFLFFIIVSFLLLDASFSSLL